MNRLIILPLLASFLLFSCGKKEVKVENETFVLSDTMARMIQLDSVRFCTMDYELSLSGEVNFNENSVIKIFPRGSGQVLESKVSLGDKVRRGQVLAVIRSADVAGNYADLNSTTADVMIAKRQLDNTEGLYQNGIASEREFTEAKENYQKALSAKNKVVSAININGGGNSNANGQYILTSPIDGYVVEKKINAGDFIRPDNGENLFTISDLKDVWVMANVYETDIPKVRQGYSVKVIPSAYGDKVLYGKIDQVSQVIDPQSKAMRVRIVLPNNDMLLKPDMFVRVVVSNVEGTRALCIPSKSLISQEGKNYVVIYNSKNDLKVSEVSVLHTVNNQTFVGGGVEAGQWLVTDKQLFIFNELVSK
ncbi:MAG: efflux RND transporter periplasmic adaptor subunit [Bacteroidetes bacterium]|nr:efflux RND transporter periplasmic adaptor subunit [Bacteroidota bacterium]